MKGYNVFYDVKNNGLLEEKCLQVFARNKSEAIQIYKKNSPKHAIFRCVKSFVNIV